MDRSCSAGSWPLEGTLTVGWDKWMDMVCFLFTVATKWNELRLGVCQEVLKNLNETLLHCYTFTCIHTSKIRTASSSVCVYYSMYVCVSLHPVCDEHSDRDPVLSQLFSRDGMSWPNHTWMADWIMVPWLQREALLYQAVSSHQCDAPAATQTSCTGTGGNFGLCLRNTEYVQKSIQVAPGRISVSNYTSHSPNDKEQSWKKSRWNSDVTKYTLSSE